MFIEHLHAMGGIRKFAFHQTDTLHRCQLRQMQILHTVVSSLSSDKFHLRYRGNLPISIIYEHTNLLFDCISEKMNWTAVVDEDKSDC